LYVTTLFEASVYGRVRGETRKKTLHYLAISFCRK